MTLAQKAVKGIFWTYFIYISQRLINLAVTAILARILVVNEFGLVAYALLIMTFIDAIKGFGINDALIYTKTNVEESAESAFIINVLIGIFQYALAYLLAPLAIYLLDDPRIVVVLRVIALSFIFDSLGKTHNALLEKELLFRKSSVPEIVANAIKAIVSIVLAKLGYGVWSIVYGQLVGTAARSAAKWIAVRWVPKLRFSKEAAKTLWQYGVHILGFSLLAVALEQADQIFIGTVLGSVQLGYYTIGVKVPELVIANFSLFISKSFFPYLTKFRDDIEKIIEGFMTTTKYTSMITIPAGIGIAAVGRELILVIYGGKWESAIVILQVLALLGTMDTLQWSVGDVLKAIGKPEVPTRILMFEALYTFPLIFIFVTINPSATMASLANLIAVTISGLIRMLVISIILDIQFSRILKLFLSPFISSMLMLGAVYGWRQLGYLWDLPLIVILIVSILTGITVYGVAIWLLEKDAIKNAWSLIQATIKSRSSKPQPA